MHREVTQWVTTRYEQRSIVSQSDINIDILSSRSCLASIRAFGQQTVESRAVASYGSKLGRELTR